MEGGKEFLIPRLENSAISLISCPRGLRVYRAGPIFNILKSYTLSLSFFFLFLLKILIEYSTKLQIKDLNI